ncbi:MAG: hypothetical protein GXO69_00210 [Acidobacteria bacterium]|nr:hypothetical protein [Acidobacteriota bacterium]
MRVELILDPDCPNAEEAREMLRQGLKESGLPVKWTEWDRSAPEVPLYVRSYGSPTILVNGRDIAGSGTESTHNCCRIYGNKNGFQGVPELSLLRKALSGE